MKVSKTFSGCRTRCSMRYQVWQCLFLSNVSTIHPSLRTLWGIASGGGSPSILIIIKNNSLYWERRRDYPPLTTTHNVIYNHPLEMMTGQLIVYHFSSRNLFLLLLLVAPLFLLRLFTPFWGRLSNLTTKKVWHKFS